MTLQLIDIIEANKDATSVTQDIFVRIMKDIRDDLVNHIKEKSKEFNDLLNEKENSEYQHAYYYGNLNTFVIILEMLEDDNQ